jgi:hypothetical protein
MHYEPASNHFHRGETPPPNHKGEEHTDCVASVVRRAQRHTL